MLKEEDAAAVTKHDLHTQDDDDESVALCFDFENCLNSNPHFSHVNRIFFPIDDDDDDDEEEEDLGN